MGGCRCTYRNCVVKSDGNTHLFHYPVFDKIRCHQWIMLARRFEFLNLTVGQLKNRVVCQHHFRDEAFMNFMKNKLKFDAIPTETGPYCAPENEVQTTVSDLPVSIDDVENNDLFTTCEKRSQMPVKYVEFLTDGVQTDINQSLLKREEAKLYEPEIDTNSMPKIKKKKLNKIKILNLQENLVGTTTATNHTFKDEKAEVKKGLGLRKIEIISHKVISEPLNMPLSGDIVDVINPNVVKKKALSKEIKKEYKEITEPSDVLSTICNTTNSTCDNIDITNVVPKVENDLLVERKKSYPRKQVSNHLTPKKRAEIQEKRKFNMKLRDIIQAGLNKSNETKVLDDKIKLEVEVPSINITEDTVINNDLVKKEDKLENDNNPNILSDLNKHYEHINKQMQIMENNLLNKLQQNESQITTVQKLLSTNKNNDTQKVLCKKKSTQTSCSEEEHKIYLFNELSEFVSEKLKNLLYEELFVIDSETNTIRTKKRKIK